MAKSQGPKPSPSPCGSLASARDRGYRPFRETVSTPCKSSTRLVHKKSSGIKRPIPRSPSFQTFRSESEPPDTMHPVCALTHKVETLFVCARTLDDEDHCTKRHSVTRSSALGTRRKHICAYGSVRFSPEPYRASIVCGQESTVVDEFDTRHGPVMS